MVAHDYRQRLLDSQDATLQSALDRIYRQLWPEDLIERIQASEDLSFQTSGRDLWVRLRTPRDGCFEEGIYETIEEKIRSPDRSTYDDVLIEHTSCAERGTAGWIYTSKADWLSYVRQPGGKVVALLIPMQPLRIWFTANRERLGKDVLAATRLAGGGQYHTLNKAVSLKDAAFRLFLNAHGAVTLETEREP